MVAAYLYRSILAAGVIVLPLSALAEPQRGECHDLIEEARKTGVVAKVTIDPNWGVVRIVVAQRYCREPIEMWNRRGLSWPVEITPGAEAPKSLLNRQNTKAPVTEIEKAVPVVAPEPVPVVKPQPVPVAPQPVAPQPAPSSEIVAPEPVVNPYATGTERPSIISEQPVIISDQVILPQSMGAGEGIPKPPDLADAVRSRMQLGGPQPEDTTKVEAPPPQSDAGFMSLGLWIALSVVGLGAGIGMLFFYRRASHQGGEEEGDGEEGEDDDEL